MTWVVLRVRERLESSQFDVSKIAQAPFSTGTIHILPVGNPLAPGHGESLS